MKTDDDICAAARQLPAPERETYLQEACPEEADRERVRALLREAAEADSFFADPVGSKNPSERFGWSNRELSGNR